MILAVGAGRPIELHHPADFSDLKVVLDSSVSPLDARQALDGVAYVGDDGHVWIAISQLQRLATAEPIPDWDEVTWDKGFRRMLAYATEHGWVDAESGAVRAHCERDGERVAL